MNSRQRQSQGLSAIIAVLSALPLLVICLGAAAVTAATTQGAVADLGRQLFFDVNLSRTRTQSCATCHDPSRAFIDARANSVGGAVSIGDDGRSLGDRNTPSLAYAALSPDFHLDDDGHYRGGFFHDGRAIALTAQAAGPLLDPREMALSDGAAVQARVLENSLYRELLPRYFGAAVLADPQRSLNGVGESLAAFERSAFFTPFDSKYDRYLRGDYTMTRLEEMGRELFFSPMTSCADCHMSNTGADRAGETFTNYRYHNIGLPANTRVRDANGLGATYRDQGLLAHPAVDDPARAGKFKVPSLRNVAVTGPYMHNGIFRELRTAILFYNRYTVNNADSRINPETGQAWGEPEFAATIDEQLLNQGQPIDEGRVLALIAFLETLTDQRFENLLGAPREQ